MNCTKSKETGATAIAQVQKNSTCVQIMNLTSEWVHLKQDEPVARVDRVSSSSIVNEEEVNLQNIESQENRDYEYIRWRIYSDSKIHRHWLEWGKFEWKWKDQTTGIVDG